MEFLPLNMDNIKARETRTDSLISELAKDGSSEFALPEESSGQGTQMMESVPSDWTDEKHHMFLESMEASFVSQMFDSAHSVRSCSNKENSRTKLHGQSQSASHIPTYFGQFKVLRGSWKNINFEPTDSRLNVLSEYQALSRNPWIHHFRAARKYKNVVCKSQASCSRGRNSLSFGSTNNSRPVRASESHRSQQSQRYNISSNREVSDQNFVDEDSEVEKGSSVCDVKRVKIPETHALSNDQPEDS